MSSIETVTILFTDLVGSTEMSSRVGPEVADLLRVEHFSLLREAVAAASGREVKNLGDGLMVAFMSVAAAIECAASMQQRIELRNRRAEHKLGVRIGVGLGEATREGGDYFGSPVIEASRLCAQASGGQVLITRLAGLMLGSRGGHRLSAPRAAQLRGFPDPVEVCELLWEPLPSERVPLPPRLQVLPDTGFVGREAIRDRLREQWRLARETERCKLALLSGEPGIGKTRLAMHLAIETRGAGATVLYGRCDDEVGLPYQPWIEALRHLVKSAPSELLEAHVEAHAGELGRLIPELSARMPDLPEPRASDPEVERYLLFGAVLGLLEEASRAEPVVLVLDDLHWADKTTLSLLKHVVRSGSPMRLLVLATFRDSEIGVEHPLTALLADLRREEGVVRVELDGLEPAEVISFVEAAAGHELTPGGVMLAREVSRETDGNPFFLGEILRHLEESGAVVQGPDGRWVVRLGLSELGLPRSVREVVGRRIQRLGETAVRVLSAAAVIGRDFDLELLALVTDRGEDELLESLDAAVAGSALRESAEVPGRFTFVHDLINHTLYEELGRTRRARLHHRVAAALEELCGDQPGDRLGELAYHWSVAVQAVDLPKAIDYAGQAAARALAQLAPDEALRWFDQALELLSSAQSPTQRDRCELLIGRGEAQKQLGEPGYRETLLEAAAIARSLEDPQRLAQAVLANTRGWTSRIFAIDQQRVDDLESTLAALADGAPERARVLATLASELSFSADFPRVRVLIDEALTTARRGPDRRELGLVLSSVLSALLRAPMLEERWTLSAELVALCDEVEDPALSFMSAAWRFIAALERGELDEVDACLERMRLLVDAIGQPWMRWVWLFFGSSRAQLIGDIDQVEALATQAGVLGAETGQPDALMIFGLQLLYARQEQDRLDEVVDLVAQRANENLDVPALQLTLGFYYAELGRLDEAVTRLNAVAPDNFAAIRMDAAWLMAMVRAADIAARVDAKGPAAALYEILLPFREHIATSAAVVYGSVERSLGLLAALLDRHDAADEHFASAIDIHERIGAQLQLARTLLNWGHVRITRGGPLETQRGRVLLGRALTIARERGGTAIERETQALLATLAPA